MRKWAFLHEYTYDLARLLVDMNETEKYGYYHATNEGGYISWYDFTKEIYRQDGYKTEAGFTPLPTWQDALSRYLKEIEQ